MERTIVFEKCDSVARITLNRPKQLNALNTQLLYELDSILDIVKAEPEIRVILLQGSGKKAFAAGADISEMASFTPEEAYAFSVFGNSIFNRLAGMTQPSIAIIQGAALGGGCELAQACDIRLAGENARFGQPEVSLGIIPGFGGTQRLSRLIGPSRAKYMLFSGAMIDAATALRWGLVDAVTPDDQLEYEGLALAHSIAANTAYAVAQCKQSVTAGLDHGFNTSISYENQAFSLCFSRQEPKMLMQNFLAKHKTK